MMPFFHWHIFKCLQNNGCQGHQKLLMHFVVILILLMATQLSNVLSIDCFKCVSYNGGNKACDDPFHNNYSTTILESPCMGGRKGRDGLFPATACIKIAGYYDDTGESITVRGCALDSGTLTTDTEIVRMSHCGKFYYDDRYVHGCLQSCSDADACNGAIGNIINIHQGTAVSFFFTYLVRVWLTIVIVWPRSLEGLWSSLIVTGRNLQRRLYSESKSISNHYQHEYRFQLEKLKKDNADSLENENKDNEKWMNVNNIR